MVKILYGWSDKWYNQEYWRRLERNWRQWKGKRPVRKGTMKTIPEEEETEKEKLRVWEWMEVLSQSLDDLGTTRSECLGRTRWSSLLDCTTYLYYFYKWLYTTSPRSHVLSRMFYNHMTCHMIWLCEFPCYLYPVFIVWLDICDQVFECVGNFLLLRALITGGRWRQNGQHGRPILRAVEKFLGMRKLKRGVVS